MMETSGFSAGSKTTGLPEKGSFTSLAPEVVAIVSEVVSVGHETLDRFALTHEFVNQRARLMVPYPGAEPVRVGLEVVPSPFCNDFHSARASWKSLVLR